MTVALRGSLVALLALALFYVAYRAASHDGCSQVATGSIVAVLNCPERMNSVRWGF